MGSILGQAQDDRKRDRDLFRPRQVEKAKNAICGVQGNPRNRENAKSTL
jgi:hypothetical protein